jgi:L-cystine transport system substrate-binding protein
MKHSRLVAILAAATMTIGLAACSSSAPTSSPAPGADAGSADLQALGDRGLVVGTEGTYRPFSFHDPASLA